MSFRQVFLIVRRYAGHSKWANIKHTKAEKDTQRSLMFIKLAHRIRLAIHENGNNANPTLNHQLASAIDYAKSKDMPASTIQNILKTAADKDAVQPFKYSIRGPRGSVLLVTALTNSYGKTKGDIQMQLKRVGGLLSDQSLESQFDKKGIVIAMPPPKMENIEESSVEHAIEAGAEEVSPIDENNKLTFTCEAIELHRVMTKLQELNYNVEDSKITFVPKMKVNLNKDEMELMSNIVARLEKISEVNEIHDNIE
ncbi:translational activator of cytochrome c oxidase 1-like [Macrosteles quadrilineatus]|uniref:translational activator of cytochrome c oxidase 1-like n=1 Tax=Macrosteles quadrilineatus TaxID=74068 RepID=UPI0023E18C20|nr:translational activator of cytochrome c oxidase 1-like [Macrosteles quadrilineatus]